MISNLNKTFYDVACPLSDLKIAWSISNYLDWTRACCQWSTYTAAIMYIVFYITSSNLSSIRIALSNGSQAQTITWFYFNLCSSILLRELSQTKSALPIWSIVVSSSCTVIFDFICMHCYLPPFFDQARDIIMFRLPKKLRKRQIETCLESAENIIKQ